MSNYEYAALVAGNGTLQGKVLAAALKRAITVKGSGSYTSGQTPSEPDRKRSLLADQILINPRGVVEKFCWAISVQDGVLAAYPGIFTDISGLPADQQPAAREAQVTAAVDGLADATLDALVAAVWDDLAGVNTWD